MCLIVLRRLTMIENVISSTAASVRIRVAAADDGDQKDASPLYSGAASVNP